MAGKPGPIRTCVSQLQKDVRDSFGTRDFLQDTQTIIGTELRRIRNWTGILAMLGTHTSHFCSRDCNRFCFNLTCAGVMSKSKPCNRILRQICKLLLVYHCSALRRWTMKTALLRWYRRSFVLFAYSQVDLVWLILWRARIYRQAYYAWCVRAALDKTNYE